MGTRNGGRPPVASGGVVPPEADGSSAPRRLGPRHTILGPTETDTPDHDRSIRLGLNSLSTNRSPHLTTEKTGNPLTLGGN